MFNNPMITSVNEVERRLEIAEQNRKQRYYEDDPALFRQVIPCPDERKPFFARLFGRGQQSQPAAAWKQADPCGESQPG
jgi:hypothetical protein